MLALYSARPDSKAKLFYAVHPGSYLGHKVTRNVTEYASVAREMVDRVPHAVHRRFSSYMAANMFAKVEPPRLPTAKELKHWSIGSAGVGAPGSRLAPADDHMSISMTSRVSGLQMGKRGTGTGEKAEHPPISGPSLARQQEESEVERLRREMAVLRQRLAATEGKEKAEPAVGVESQFRQSKKTRELREGEALGGQEARRPQQKIKVRRVERARFVAVI